MLYGSTAALPLFLQSLLGYTATQSGMVLSPGGIVVMAFMPIVGILVAKVQPRWLVMFGLIGIFVGPVVLAVSYTLLRAWLGIEEEDA